MIEPTKEEIRDYIKTAVTYPIANLDQIVSMVVLHFDIPDKAALRIIQEILYESL